MSVAGPTLLRHAAQCGRTSEWIISNAEIQRYLNEGLLPQQPGRPASRQRDYSHLPIREETVDAPEAATVCACCGLPLESAGYQSPEVRFSRYELLKLLAWPDNTRNYQRLAQSLRRWKGLTIFSDRAFYDHAAKSWVNRDFSVFDNLQIYHRESPAGSPKMCKSRFTWNEVIVTAIVVHRYNI